MRMKKDPAQYLTVVQAPARQIGQQVPEGKRVARSLIKRNLQVLTARWRLRLGR